MLMQAVESYLLARRAGGYDLSGAGRLLADFARVAIER